MSEKYKTLLSNTGLLFVGTFGSRMISFIMLPFYTNWLSVVDFGTSDMINVYSTILVSIVSLCIAEAVFVIPTGRNRDEQKIFFSSSIMFALLCTIVLLFLYIIVLPFRDDNSSSFISCIGYITVLCGTNIFMSIAQQFCKCINRIRVFAFAGILNTVIVAVLGFAFISSFGLMGYVSSLVAANIVTLCYVYIGGGLYEYLSINAISKQYLLELLRYSVPLIPNSIIWLIVSYINRPIMEASLGMVAIGLYSLANRFPTLITTLYNNFSNSWQISVLQEFDKKGYESFYNRTCMIVFVGMCLCVSLLTLVIQPVIQFFFNEKYYSVIEYIPWLCLSTPFMALASIVGANFSAIKQSKYFFYSSIWSAGSAVIFNILLIPVLGIWGACIASVISFVVGVFTRIIYSHKIVHLKCLGVYMLFTLLTIIILILHTYKMSSVIMVSFVLIELFVTMLVMRKYYKVNKI